VKKIRNFFDAFFSLSRSERNGVVVLLSIVLILIVVRVLLPYLIKPDKTSAEKFKNKLELIEERKKIVGEEKYPTNKGFEKQYTKKTKSSAANNFSSDEKDDVELFHFDPNKITYEEMLSLGFKKYVAENIISYREKGGIFKKSTDLAKIYGLDSQLFIRVEPYIFFVRDTEPIVPKIEINTADSIKLQQVKGIGPVLASRIFKFREQLGGFYDLEQLKEVYKLSEETYQTIIPQLDILTTDVRKININFVDINQLKAHPYCNYSNARKIIDHRSKNGRFESVEDILEKLIVDTVTYNRLVPYLSIE
jgi:competence protein ComEA